MQACLHPRRATAMQRQPIGRNQQHLEEHKQVEQVAGEKSTIDAHQLELKQPVKVGPFAVITAARIQQGRKGQHRGEQHHHGTEPVQHQHDAERRLPVAQFVNGISAVPGLIDQHHTHGQQGRTGE